MVFISNYKIVQIDNKEYLYANNQLKLVKAFENSSSKILFYFCQFGQCFNALKMLIHNGADVLAGKDYALRWASGNGHL